MTATTQTSFSRLLDASNELLANLIDAGKHKPDLLLEGSEEYYPLGVDGDPWYPDVWELDMAEEAARKDKALYDAAGDLLASLKEFVEDLKKHATFGLNDHEVDMLQRAEDIIAKAELTVIG